MDSEERTAARAALDAAVRAYVKVVANEAEFDDVIVLGWAGFAEYTNVELDLRDQTGRATLVPDGQNGSMSRGLMHFGVDSFS